MGISNLITLEEFNEFNGAGEVQEEEVEATAETVDELTPKSLSKKQSMAIDDKDKKMEEAEDHDDKEKMDGRAKKKINLMKMKRTRWKKLTRKSLTENETR